jgi:hypothetical protein
LLALIAVPDSFGQEKERPHPFTYRKPGIFRLYTGLTAPPPNRPDKFDRFNTDFFWNSWEGETNNVKTKFYAIGHAINLMFDVPFDKKGRVGIGIGLGYSHFNVRSDGEFNFIPNQAGTKFHTQLAKFDPPDRWINRTVFDFVEIPFELRLRAARERGKFKFYPGFRFGYMFEYYHKHRVEGAEFKEFNFPNINRWHYGPTLRIGVDNYMLFAYYDMSALFSEPTSGEPASSDLRLFGLGVSFGFF